MCTAMASIPQSPAGDSSPYEGALKGSKVAPCGANKFAAKPRPFWGRVRLFGGFLICYSHTSPLPLPTLGWGVAGVDGWGFKLAAGGRNVFEGAEPLSLAALDSSPLKRGAFFACGRGGVEEFVGDL